MARTATSMEEFRRCCTADYIVIAAKRGVDWLLGDARECEEAERWFSSINEDPSSALRARVRAAVAHEVASMGEALIRREARHINMRKGHR